MAFVSLVWNFKYTKKTVLRTIVCVRVCVCDCVSKLYSLAMWIATPSTIKFILYTIIVTFRSQQVFFEYNFFNFY